MRSCCEVLLELDMIIKEKLNEGMSVAILTTDISAGFNLVRKEILVLKMQCFGFGTNSFKLLRNYLTGRQTKVKVKSSFNMRFWSFLLNTTGVGEGSVLGPNFF